MHTGTWIAWVTLVTVVALATTNPLYLAILLLCIVLVAVLAPRTETAATSFKVMLIFGCSMLVISVFIATINGNYGDHILFTMPGPEVPGWLGGLRLGGPVSAEGLVAASVRGMAILSIFLAFGVFNGAVSPHRVLRTTPGALFHASLVLTVGLALLPASIEDLRRIREMRALRGARGGMRDLPALIVPAVINGLERSMRLAEAMEARGYAASALPPARARLSAAASAPLLVAAAWLWFYSGGQWKYAGATCAFFGALGLLWWVWEARQVHQTTSFSADPLPARERIAVVASCAVSVCVISFRTAGMGAFAYNPFAGLPAPGFAIWGALGVASCAWPAAVLVAAERKAPATTVAHSRRTGDPDVIIARAESVTYAYPGADRPALRDISLSIAEAELSLVAGPSGGGKSTLLRLFNGLVPQFHGGTISGGVTVDGMDAFRTPTRQLSLAAGMVFQEPEAQSVAETVIEEIAFGMEQRAVARTEMHRRADQLLAELGIEHLRHRRQPTLSGGERQRVALAAVLAMEPRLLLLDEPTSQLDESGAQTLILALIGLRQRRGLSILVSEHRLDRLLPQADRVVEVEDGVVRAMTPVAALSALKAVPATAELFRQLDLEPVPHTGRTSLQLPSDLVVQPRKVPTPGDVLLRLDGVSLAYGEHVALREVSFDLREGELVAIVGPNGSGKSSLFRAITGLTRPFEGTISYGAAGQLKSTREITGLAGLVPQDPAIALYRESVREEIAETLSVRGRGKVSDVALADAIDRWGLDSLAERNPRDISVGQQQRVAVAAMLAHGPKVWLLDEPTRGADAAAKRALGERLTAQAAAGGAAIVATHDIESAAQFATRVITLQDGSIISDLPARVAFAADGPHPTQVARLVPGAIAANEVQRASR